MAKILIFTPRTEWDAQKNLEDFIFFARTKLTVFGADLPFDDIVWDVTKTYPKKGKNNQRQQIWFTTLATARNTKKDIIKDQMSDVFRPFAQAYMRQMQVMKSVKDFGRRLAALRVLEAALTENGTALSPVKINSTILNRAAELANEHFTKKPAYQIGGQLEQIVDFMKKKKLTTGYLDWRNPLKRPDSGRSRIGEEFDKLREQKLPTDTVLKELPYIFCNAVTPIDILVSATGAILLCSAPDRISEVLTLPVACETTGLKGNRYGLRWWPVKGALPMIKWVLPSMESIVRDALEKIRALTEPARVIAKWYEKNPDQIFLPPHLEHLRNREFISTHEAGEVLFGVQGTNQKATDWCRERNVPRKKLDAHHFVVSFSLLEQTVLSMLPADFPILDPTTELPFGDALMIVQKQLLGKRKSTPYGCMIEALKTSTINDGLGARKGKQSIFERFGATEPDGSRVQVTTHQFRHYLNTLTQGGDVTQVDIAKWSGRKNISQNDDYDHRSADEMLQMGQDVVGDITKIMGSIPSIPEHRLIRRDEFARLSIPTAHTTDIGYCLHDYTMEPCPTYMDCINCAEHVVLKGDAAKTQQIRQQFYGAEGLLAKAITAVEDGDYGSDRWLEHHKKTTEHLRWLCKLLDDPEVPAGTVINLGVKSPSRIEQVATTNPQLSSTVTDDDESEIYEIGALMFDEERSA